MTKKSTKNETENRTNETPYGQTMSKRAMKRYWHNHLSFKLRQENYGRGLST